MPTKNQISVPERNDEAALNGVTNIPDSLITAVSSLHDVVLVYTRQLICIYSASQPAYSSFYDNATESSIFKLNRKIPESIIEFLLSGRPVDGTLKWRSLDPVNKITQNTKLISVESNNELFYVQCIDIEKVNEQQSTLEHSYSLLQKEYLEVSEIIENATEIIFKLDRQGHFIFVSSEFERSLGHCKHNILGSHFSTLIHPDDVTLTFESFARIANHDEVVPSLSFRVIHADGYFRWFTCSAIFVFDENKQPLHSIGFAQDITELKEALGTLQASEERYATFIHHISQGIWRVEVDNPPSADGSVEDIIGCFRSTGFIAECNYCMAAMYGFESPSAMEGKFIDDIFRFDEPEVRSYLVEFVKTGFRLNNREVTLIDRNGLKKTYLFNLQGIVKDGLLLRVWGTQLDISAHKEAERQKLHLAQVVQNVSDAIVSTDLEFNITAWNNSAELFYQYPAEQVMGKPFREFVQHQYITVSREEALSHLLVHDQWRGEAFVDRPDGSRIYLEISLSFIKNEKGERIGFAGIHKDITEQRKSAEALKVSEERYRSLVDALGEGILLFDKSGSIVAMNRSAQETLDVNPNNIGYPTASRLNYYQENGDPFPVEGHPVQVTLKTGKSFKQVVMGFSRNDGRVYWISVNTEPVYYNEKLGLPDAVVVSFIDITETKAARAEILRNEQRLREYSERITNILDSITDGFIAVDKDTNILLWNQIIANITGISAEDAIGKSLSSVFPSLLSSGIYPRYLEAMKSEKTLITEHYFGKKNIWFETCAYPSTQGLFVYFRDITERKEQERLLSLEKEVLEINALPDTSLQATLNYYLKKLEHIYPGMICSVVGLKNDRKTLTNLAAPTLEQGFSDKIEGLKIGPNVGSCGTAMYLKKPVLSSNIITDPGWTQFSDIAREHQIESCWSFPIMNSKQEVEATLAVYHKYPKSPSAKEYSFLERESKLLGIIISNKKAEENIKLSYERYLLATRATDDVIYDWDIANDLLYWAESYFVHFGYQPADPEDAFRLWEAALHPDDRSRVIESLNYFLNNKISQTWECEYRMRHNAGHYLLINERGFLVYNRKGEVTRMVGSVEDVTERRLLEKTVLKQEVDKQKSIALAVVDAQEKERAEIGKDLHDNVNQILSTARLFLELACSDEKERMNLIRRSSSTISDAINEIRGISRSLVPPSVSDLGLIESISDLADSINTTRKLTVEFYHQGEIDALLLQQQKMMIFRIIQEQVNNVLKHAEARFFIIELALDDNELEITLSDDGKGFDLNNIRHKKGVGLTSIKSRVELFNGEVKIITSPGKGCTMHIHIPILNP